MQLTELSIYPVKSCAGFSVPSAGLDRFGLAGDRRWMVVDESGLFITQRQIPGMCLIDVQCVAGGICVTQSHDTLEVSIPDEGAQSRRVEVWGDAVQALDAGDAAAHWFTQRLGRACRLVYMPDSALRRVDGAYAGEGETVSFADGFPLLLISRASLEDLNGRLPQPVPMNRFRPNLVVSGCEAFAEDGWRRIRIGQMELDVAKPCSRCVMPSIVQETGERDPHINRALAAFRRVNGQILFGQNLLYRGSGQLAVGDKVEVLA